MKGQANPVGVPSRPLLEGIGPGPGRPEEAIAREGLPIICCAMAWTARI